MRNCFQMSDVKKLMTRKLHRVVFGLAVLICGPTIVAQESPTTDPVDPTFRTGVTQILAPTIVLDKGGAYVAGIRPQEFRLFDNGKPQDIKVDEFYAPISLVVAIQANNKVEAVLPKIQKLGTLLRDMVAGDQGEVAIAAFDHRFQLLQDFTNNADALEAGLKKLKPGSTSNATTDAIIQSTRMLSKRPKDRRKVILLIAESLERGSTGKPREALLILEIHNVMVYALNVSRMFTELTAKPEYPRPDHIPTTARHVPAGGVQTPTTVAQLYGQAGYTANFIPLIEEIFRAAKAVFVPNSVEVFTRYTGGKEFPFISQKELERSVAEVGRELHNQYLITYTPNNPKEGGFHDIRVEVARAGLEVRTRDGYWRGATE
jgi:VWFA-related protein